MALLNKKLTPREISAIYYHIFGGCADWVLLYAIADGIDVQDIKNRSAVYKWKNSHKIQDLLSKVQEEKTRLLASAEKAEKRPISDDGDSTHTTTQPQPQNAKFTDFSRPENQFRKLNELVNTATDSAETLDALKVIMSAQKADREAARDGKAVKCYIPISCKDCKLYEKARKKVSL